MAWGVLWASRSGLGTGINMLAGSASLVDTLNEKKKKKISYEELQT